MSVTSFVGKVAIAQPERYRQLYLNNAKLWNTTCHVCSGIYFVVINYIAL